MKTLYLIRHGQTEWNLQKRMQGRLDSPLTETGVEQAHTHGRLLKAIAGIRELHVSPSGRTRETAYILNSYVAAPLNYVDALLERDVGHWSGLTMEEIAEAFPREHRARRDDAYHFRPPKGENLADMRERVSEFLGNIRHSAEEEIGLVTHQIMSRVILGSLLDLDPAATVRILQPNDVVYRLRFAHSAVNVEHFANGDGPKAGLLQHSDSETIVKLETPGKDAGN